MNRFMVPINVTFVTCFIFTLQTLESLAHIFQQIKNCSEYDMTTKIVDDEIDDLDIGNLSCEDIHHGDIYDEEIHEEDIEIHEYIHDLDFLDDLDFSINESFSAFGDIISEDQSIFHEPNEYVQKNKI